MKMKKLIGLFFLVVLVTVFFGCVSYPSFDRMISQREQGKKLVFIFSSGLTMRIITNPSDIEAIKKWGTINTINQVSNIDERFPPIIVYDRADAAAVFELPQDINEVLVIVSQTRVSGGNMYFAFTSELITLKPDSDIEGYWFVGGDNTYIKNELTYDSIVAKYSKKGKYAQPWDNKRIQLGFVQK
jgi:hypothetical protein